jgi:hypothetical protein
MDLDAVMQEVADRLDTITGLRVDGYPAGSVTPPAAVLSYPEVTYDETMRRGMDRYVLPVWVLVGKVSDRAARATIAPYLDGGGPKSVKTVLEADPYDSLDSVRVQRADPDVVSVGGVEYLAYQFTLDIAGPGGT